MSCLCYSLPHLCFMWHSVFDINFLANLTFGQPVLFFWLPTYKNFCCPFILIRNLEKMLRCFFQACLLVLVLQQWLNGYLISHREQTHHTQDFKQPQSESFYSIIEKTSCKLQVQWNWNRIKYYLTSYNYSWYLYSFCSILHLFLKSRTSNLNKYKTVFSGIQSVRVLWWGVKPFSKLLE